MQIFLFYYILERKSQRYGDWRVNAGQKLLSQRQFMTDLNYALVRGASQETRMRVMTREQLYCSSAPPSSHLTQQ
jgi:hypothetical protein